MYRLELRLHLIVTPVVIVLSCFCHCRFCLSLLVTDLSLVFAMCLLVFVDAPLWAFAVCPRNDTNYKQKRHQKQQETDKTTGQHT